MGQSKLPLAQALNVWATQVFLDENSLDGALGGGFKYFLFLVFFWTKTPVGGGFLQIFFGNVHPQNWGRWFPFWRSYFSDGLVQPPPRNSLHGAKVCGDFLLGDIVRKEEVQNCYEQDVESKISGCSCAESSKGLHFCSWFMGHGVSKSTFWGMVFLVCCVSWAMAGWRTLVHHGAPRESYSRRSHQSPVFAIRSIKTLFHPNSRPGLIDIFFSGVPLPSQKDYPPWS